MAASGTDTGASVLTAPASGAGAGAGAGAGTGVALDAAGGVRSPHEVATSAIAIARNIMGDVDDHMIRRRPPSSPGEAHSATSPRGSRSPCAVASAVLAATRVQDRR